MFAIIKMQGSLLAGFDTAVAVFAPLENEVLAKRLRRRLDKVSWREQRARYNQAVVGGERCSFKEWVMEVEPPIFHSITPFVNLGN
jgi:hypothetical protein